MSAADVHLLIHIRPPTLPCPARSTSPPGVIKENFSKMKMNWVFWTSLWENLSKVFTKQYVCIKYQQMMSVYVCGCVCCVWVLCCAECERMCTLSGKITFRRDNYFVFYWLILVNNSSIEVPAYFLIPMQNFDSLECFHSVPPDKSLSP